MVRVLPCITTEDILKTFYIFCVAMPILSDTVLSCQPNGHFFRETLSDPSESWGDLPPIALVLLYLFVGV